MKKNLLLTVAALALGSVAAFEFDLNTLQPGVVMSSAAGGEQAQTSSEGKPAARGPFRLNSPKRPLNGVVEISADHELILKPVPGGKDGMIVIYTPIPKLAKVRIGFKVKCEEFFVKGKPFNSMAVTIGGAGVQFRGNTFDMRYLDGGAQPRAKYVPLTKMQDNEWQDVVMEISCGDTQTYSINDKKDVVRRNKIAFVRAASFSAYFNQVKPGTCVRIKDLKITELQ